MALVIGVRLPATRSPTSRRPLPTSTNEFDPSPWSVDKKAHGGISDKSRQGEVTGGGVR